MQTHTVVVTETNTVVVDRQFAFDFLPTTVGQKPIVVQARAQQISSAAGLLPIRQFDERLKYTE